MRQHLAIVQAWMRLGDRHYVDPCRTQQLDRRGWKVLIDKQRGSQVDAFPIAMKRSSLKSSAANASAACICSRVRCG